MEGGLLAMIRGELSKCERRGRPPSQRRSEEDGRERQGEREERREEPAMDPPRDPRESPTGTEPAGERGIEKKESVQLMLDDFPKFDCKNFVLGIKRSFLFIFHMPSNATQ